MDAKSIRLQRQLVVEGKQLVSPSILDVPVLLVEQTLQQMVKDPSFFESKLSQRGNSDGKSNAYGYDRALFYANLFRSINNIKSKGERSSELGGMGVIVESLKQADRETVIGLPDITFHVRGYGEFSIVPANHFEPSRPELLTLQLPKTLIPFARWLMGQKNWIVRTLTDCYFAIGKYQAAFLISLDPSTLLELPISKIRDKFGWRYNASTYWRLLNNRSVNIMSPAGVQFLPVSHLLPTKDDILRYQWIPRFNALMEEEHKTRTACSDEEVARRLGMVARRTVAKYREGENIPGHSERQQAYRAGRSEPYRLPLFMSKPLPSFGEKTPEYPLGYGYCQCGCGQVTRMARDDTSSAWVWMRYLDEHQSRREEIPSQLPMPMRPVSTNRAPQIDRANRQSASQQAVSSGSTDRDSQTGLRRRNQLLSAELALLRVNIELVASLVDSLWQGSEEGKKLILEKLKELSRKQAE